MDSRRQIKHSHYIFGNNILSVLEWLRWQSRKTPSSPCPTGKPKLQLFTEHPLMRNTGQLLAEKVYNQRFKEEATIKTGGRGRVMVQSRLILPVGDPRCCCSVTKSCLTLCDPMNCNTPTFPVLHNLLGLA